MVQAAINKIAGCTMLNMLTFERGCLYHLFSNPSFLFGEKSALKCHRPASSFTSLLLDSRGKSSPLPTGKSNTTNTSQDSIRTLSMLVGPGLGIDLYYLWPRDRGIV